MTIVQLRGRSLVFADAPSVEYRHGQPLLCVRGTHDACTVASLAEELARVMAWDHDDVTVDLTGVEFMDSSTVGVLTRARAFLEARGRSLRLQSPSRPARRLLDLCLVQYDLAPPSPSATNLHGVDSA